jgi:hypothetical protein
MKKLTLLLLILGYSTVNAQIVLEKQFPGLQMNVINLSLTYYYSTDISKSQISVYKENYSFLKTFTFTPPSNYSFGSATISDKVFNNLADLEFLVLVNKVSGDATDADASKFLLYNENGQIIYDFGAGSILSSFFIKTASGASKMILQRLIYNMSNLTITTNTEIYSLPGNYTGISAVKSTNEVNVKYNSQNRTVEFFPTEISESLCLKLYNIEGKELIQRNYNGIIDGKITVSSEGLTSGVYIYSLNENSGKIILK